jgi:hypothetical protein
MPAGAPAWLAIALFGLIDASCFQVQTTAFASYKAHRITVKLLMKTLEWMC